MKRILTLIVVFFTMISTFAQSSGITLSYNKGQELVLFSSDQLAEAIEVAEVNDTIYLSQGVYSLDKLPKYLGSSDQNARQLVKPLVFIGAGSYSTGTVIRADELYINIDPSIDLDKRVISFDGIEFSDTSVYESLTNLILISDISELKFLDTKFDFIIKSDAHIDNLFVTFCESFVLNIGENNVGKVIVNYSYVSNVYGKCKDGNASYYFDHCLIKSLKDNFTGFVTHSVIVEILVTNPETRVFDCVYKSVNNSNKNILDNCKSPDLPNVFNNIFLLRFGGADDYYEWFGNCSDGTVYGMYGGVNRPTLNHIYISGSKIEYDAINKKLIITVKY